MISSTLIKVLQLNRLSVLMSCKQARQGNKDKRKFWGMNQFSKLAHYSPLRHAFSLIGSRRTNSTIFFCKIISPVTHTYDSAKQRRALKIWIPAAVAKGSCRRTKTRTDPFRGCDAPQERGVRFANWRLEKHAAMDKNAGGLLSSSRKSDVITWNFESDKALCIWL